MAESEPDDVGKLPVPRGFFVRFGAKESEPGSGRSPTSPLDLSVFANFGGLFSPRSPHRHTKWLSPKLGLSFLCSSIVENHSFTRDNIVLAPQIKSTLVNTPPNQLSDPCVEPHSLSDELTSVTSHPLRDTVAAEEVHYSPRRSSSSPMDIIYSRSLSAREMALSEDYTCIISHGPNPKTTHMFGDCILDCDPKELGGLGAEDEIEKPEGSSSQLCLCTSNPQDCQNIHINREAEASAEKGGVEDSLEISPGSSYNEEDLFHMAMPVVNP